jgi:hypothetical protein
LVAGPCPSQVPSNLALGSKAWPSSSSTPASKRFKITERANHLVGLSDDVLISAFLYLRVPDLCAIDQTCSHFSDGALTNNVAMLRCNKNGADCGYAMARVHSN